MSLTSSQSTSASSEYSTPVQTPIHPSPSLTSTVITVSEIMNEDANGTFAQTYLGLMSSNDGLFHTVRAALSRYVAELVQEERYRIAELRRLDAETNETLRNDRDSALSHLHQARARADDIERNLEAEIRERQKLEEDRRWNEETIETLQKQRHSTLLELLEEKARADELAQKFEEESRERQLLHDRAVDLNEALRVERTEISAVRNRLQDADLRLSGVESQYSEMENTWTSRNNELRNELTKTRQQLETANSSVIEERTRSDDCFTELATAKAELKEAHRERVTLEAQVEDRTNELATSNTRLQREGTRVSEVQENLAQARLEAEHSAHIRRHQEGVINDLEEQNHVMNVEVQHLNSELHNEQKRSRDLQSTLSNQLQQLHEQNKQLVYLQAVDGDLSNTSKTLQRTKTRMAIRIYALRERCRTLVGELKEVRSINNDLSKVRAKPPRSPAIVRYKHSPPRMALVRKGPVTVESLPRK
ncbi:uncharacterized protein BDV14DRAFT_80216 [Aspergillus stella-maris]|uniref:uncharacterized protein n=1 Tax=Aspergillus stella-maris TaxID=1810926 RepID=UPI003CCDB197